MTLTKQELYEIKGGGFSLSVSALNAISRLMTTLMKIGQTIGSNAKRRIFGLFC